MAVLRRAPRDHFDVHTGVIQLHKIDATKSKYPHCQKYTIRKNPKLTRIVERIWKKGLQGHQYTSQSFRAVYLPSNAESRQNVSIEINSKNVEPPFTTKNINNNPTSDHKDRKRTLQTLHEQKSEAMFPKEFSKFDLF